MKPIRSYIVMFITGMLFFLHVSAQETGSAAFVKVSGEVTKPLTLHQNELIKMKQSTAELIDRDGKLHSYTGVALQEILEMAGVTMGNQLRGENLSKYLLVKCADGYEVVFSLAETDSSFSDRLIILAYSLEGNPLAEGKGPFRLVVPGEKKPARSCMQVTEFVIKFSKE